MSRKFTDAEKDAYVMMKELIKKPTNLSAKDFTPGQMVLCAYVAKYDKNPYDATPLILVLKRSRTYTLGLNFHWIPRNIRKVFVDYIYKNNRKNIQQNLPLTLDYKLIKNLLIKFGAPALRLYINRRFSPKGVIIPQTQFYKAVNLKAESFIGISAEQAWALAKSKMKARPNKMGSTRKLKIKKRKR